MTLQIGFRGLLVKARDYRPGDAGSNPTRGIISKMSLRVFFRPKSAPTQGWECYNPNGKAGTTQPSIIRFKDTSLRVLLL